MKLHFYLKLQYQRNLNVKSGIAILISFSIFLSLQLLLGMTYKH